MNKNKNLISSEARGGIADFNKTEGKRKGGGRLNKNSTKKSDISCKINLAYIQFIKRQ